MEEQTNERQDKPEALSGTSYGKSRIGGVGVEAPREAAPAVEIEA